eukprot:4529741-Lingulodinium_polyedra.AAC.1
MTHIFSAAGAPRTTLQLVPQTVETCRACRMWSKPGPKAIATATLSVRFNERVQCDLLFYEQYIVFNMIDEAINCHVAVEVPSRRAEPLLSAFMTSW